MVWKAKKSRRVESRSPVPTYDQSTGLRAPRPCLRASQDDTLFVNHQHVNSSERDQSAKSSRSPPSALSGSVSSKTRETVGSDDHAKSYESGCSGDSGISCGMSHIKTPQHYANGSGQSLSVRFSIVAIREHERAVGDNPSCSTGPPIGIGWRHTDTREISIDEYEDKRQYRRKNMVLSRSQREELLLNWGASFDDIIDSIRANIRAKNQRRQTITNIGKVDRFEEALEGATRRIKRVFLLRRSTTDKAKKLQEQATVAAKIYPPTSGVSGYHHTCGGQVAGISSAEKVHKKEVCKEVSLTAFEETIPSGMKFTRATSFLSNIDDSRTSVSGFSFGNSTTASAKELEHFYQELEFEMFGDMPLPDMVGETLFLPHLTQDDECIYNDVSSDRTIHEPPQVTPLHAKMLDEETSCEFSDESMNPLRPIADDGYVLFYNDPLAAIRMGLELPPTVQMNTDLDPSVDFGSVEQHRVDRARAYLSETVTAMEQRYLHPSLAPPLHRGLGHRSDDSSPESDSGSLRSSRSQNGMPRSRRKDYPTVCHIPLYSRRSATHWIEGYDESAAFGIHSPDHEVITITEDSRWDDRIRESPSSQPGPPTPGYVAPPRFPIFP